MSNTRRYYRKCRARRSTTKSLAVWKKKDNCQAGECKNLH